MPNIDVCFDSWQGNYYTSNLVFPNETAVEATRERFLAVLSRSYAGSLHVSMVRGNGTEGPIYYFDKESYSRWPGVTLDFRQFAGLCPDDAFEADRSTLDSIPIVSSIQLFLVSSHHTLYSTFGVYHVFLLQ